MGLLCQSTTWSLIHVDSHLVSVLEPLHHISPLPTHLQFNLFFSHCVIQMRLMSYVGPYLKKNQVFKFGPVKIKIKNGHGEYSNSRHNHYGQHSYCNSTDHCTNSPFLMLPVPPLHPQGILKESMQPSMP